MFPGYHPLQVRRDMAKAALHMPFAVPIVKLAYTDDDGARRHISIYPTLQFLYSHHVCPEYVTREVRELPIPPPQPTLASLTWGERACAARVRVRAACGRRGMALASRVLRQCSLVITPRCASCLRPSRSLATLASTAGDSRFLTR